MRIGKRLQISGGFGLLLAVLLFLDSGAFVLWALLACALHELGHYIVIRLLGGEVQELSLTMVGAEMRPMRERIFSYREEFFIILAGPATSLIVAAVAGVLVQKSLGEFFYLFCGLNLVLGLFNLLPVLPLDGGRLLYIAFAQKEEAHCAQRRVERFGLLMGVAVLAGGAWVLWRGGTCTLLLMGFWLLAGRGGVKNKK